LVIPTLVSTKEADMNTTTTTLSTGTDTPSAASARRSRRIEGVNVMSKKVAKFGVTALAAGAALVGGGVAKADGVVQQAPVYQWVLEPNSCLFLSNDGGASGVVAVCPIQGGFEIDVAPNAQWTVYGQYAYQGPWDVDQAEWLASVDGGGASMTGDPAIDGYLSSVNQALTDPWVQQTCVQISGDVCYV
jgi:hypothetical protein